MELPNLSQVIDTYVPVSNMNFSDYIKQLRRDLLPHIRKLQVDGRLRWFSFLLHGAQHLGGREPNNGRCFIHIRLEPVTGIDPEEFINMLPSHFHKPLKVSLSENTDFESDKFDENNWIYAWKILGDSSEWVLGLLEGHKDVPPIEHILQFMHYITNPLMLGKECMYIPNGIKF